MGAPSEKLISHTVKQRFFEVGPLPPPTQEGVPMEIFCSWGSANGIFSHMGGASGKFALMGFKRKMFAHKLMPRSHGGGVQMEKKIHPPPNFGPWGVQMELSKCLSLPRSAYVQLDPNSVTQIQMQRRTRQNSITYKSFQNTRYSSFRIYKLILAWLPTTSYNN